MLQHSISKRRLFIKGLPTLTALVLAFQALVGQPYYFRHYEVESGLSNNSVLCSIQDKQGFMWFGTRDGLNRFDGYSFKVYRFSNNRKIQNESNLIISLHIDDAGTILAATESEIYQYDSQSDTFVLQVTSPYYPISQVKSDNRGNIWFIAHNILIKYSRRLKELKPYNPQIFFNATSLSVDKENVVWVSTPNGILQQYNEKDEAFISYDLFEHSNKNLPKFIFPILCVEDGKILIGTNRAGVKVFDTKNRTYLDINLCENLDNLIIRTFMQAGPTEFWIGTETGIYIYNSKTGESKKIEKNTTNQYAISDNVIYAFCKDREGGIWIGTYFGGVNYYPKQYTPFQKFYYKPFESSLSGNIVREMTNDKYGNLWVGTEDGGLNKFNPKTGEFTNYKPNNIPGSISYVCAHTLLSEDNELWLGTFQHGLDILNIATGKVVRHYGNSPNNGFRSNFPFCFFKSATGDIVVGTVDDGVYLYNRNKDFFEPFAEFPSKEFCRYILQDSHGTFWASLPGKGVYFVNRKNGSSGSFSFNASDSTSLSSSVVNSIFQDSKNNLWFTTENGLSLWNPSKRTFKRYGTADGFPANFLMSMLEDEKGLLWISTTNGLVCFNPENGRIQVYTTANGLLSDQFSYSSALKTKEGRMFFGSAKGLISFHPSEFRQDSFVPPVYITGLQVNNQEIVIGQKGSPLQQSIIYTDKITLSHDQSTFSLDLAALGYTAPQNLTYAYKLKGLSDNWIYFKGNRKVNFTKLRPGVYVFSVKASSTSDIWDEHETKLTIKILPPWWASTPAYIIYAVLAISLMYYILHSYHTRIEEKNKRKIALLEIAKEKEIMQLEMAKEKEMLDSKLNFFTNVAHEIRTPLTLIKIPLATVIEKAVGQPVIENCLKIMERNTNRLLELSTQLLDFRQTEIKGYSIKLEKANISEMLTDAHTNFGNLAQQNNIHVTLYQPSVPLYAFIDVDAFQKILYNLLSNAVKYAATSVDLTLTTNTTENSFTIRIKNDGYLIPEDLKEKIFEPFYRIKETETQQGTGIGLALARSLTQIQNGNLLLGNTEGNMNVFSLTLPINHNVENN